MKANSRAIAATVAVSMLAAGYAASAEEKGKTLDKSVFRTPAPNADGNYNIIFITTDQEHYFSEFPEGSSYRARELLAQLGTTFEKHYSCSTMSTSSRSVIYTGTHITNTKMIDNTDFDWQGPLSTGIVTVGDLLRRAGYYTAYKGKWHMGDVSLLGAAGDGQTDLGEYGFSDWGVDSDYTSTIWEGFERDGEIQSDAIEWLRKTGTEKNSSGISFFLAVNLINPHDIMFFNTDPDFRGTLPVGGPPDAEIYRKTYDTAVPSSWNQNLADGTLPPAVSAYKTRWEGWTGSVTTEEGWKDFRNYYFNCIQDSDNHLLEILQEIADLGMMENTIIVFTADHGEMGGSHNLKGKGGVIFEENIHVPLVVYHPEFEGGRRVSSVTSHLDLAPTFVHMTNISEEKKAEITSELKGKNLMDLMRNPFGSVRDGSLFCFETLFYRDKGGRIFKAKPWAEAEGTSGAGFKAMIEVDASTGGTVSLVSRARAKKQLVRRMVQIAAERVDGRKLRGAIVHINAAQDASCLERMLREEMHCESLHVSHGRAVTAIQNGEGFITFGFYAAD